MTLTGSFSEHTFSSQAGSRPYWLYVPSSYNGTKAVPLVVMLHGCTQDAADIARGSRLNERAEAEGFIVAYPQQPVTNNPLKCWNWYDARHQRADSGEAAVVAGITREVIAAHKIDSKRVYLAGISAGAAMGNIVAVNNPELYSALALHAGLEYKAATVLGDARKAMNEGGPDPVEQGRLAREAMGVHARIIPTLIVQGALDKSVPPLHAEQLSRQWLATAALLNHPADNETATTETSAGGYHFTRTIYTDAKKRVLVETIVVDEMGHALSGGSADGTFTDPKGPDAIAEMLRFFSAATK